MIGAESLLLSSTTSAREGGEGEEEQETTRLHGGGCEAMPTPTPLTVPARGMEILTAAAVRGCG